MKSRSIQKNAEVRLASTSLPSACDFPIPFEARHNQPESFASYRDLCRLLYADFQTSDFLQSCFYSGSRPELLRGCIHHPSPVARERRTAGPGKLSRHDADGQGFSLVYDQTNRPTVGP